MTIAECDNSSETQYFWFRTTLDSTDTIEDVGGMRVGADRDAGREEGNEGGSKWDTGGPTPSEVGPA